MTGSLINAKACEPARVCAVCGNRIDSPVFAIAGEQCCCEACLLKRMQPNAGPNEPERAPGALAEALAELLDAREQETGLHSKRVACHTLVLARRFTTDPAVLRQIHLGALLHDIGKVAIPDAILLKPGSLTAGEWAVMRRHPELGYQVVSKVPGLTAAAEMVLAHQERFDGSGYPRGLSGKDIPLGARLFAVIDTLDAMTSDRPYRRALAYDVAKSEILRLAGTQFDPAAVEAFVAEESTLRQMVDLKCHTTEAP